MSDLQKSNRLKYVRALERFKNSNISYLRDESFVFEVFVKRVTKTFKVLEKVEAIRLDSAYPLALQQYVNLILAALAYENQDEESQKRVQNNLLKEANLLAKERNKTNYKKDKHKNKKFKEE